MIAHQCVRSLVTTRAIGSFVWHHSSTYLSAGRIDRRARMIHDFLAAIRTTEETCNFRGERRKSPFCCFLCRTLASGIGRSRSARRTLYALANKWPAITCNLPSIYYIYIYTPCLLPSLVFVNLFGVALPPRGRYIDCRVIVSAQRPETQV